MVIVGRWDAQLVWALRTALRMSQEELGQHLEVADRTIRAWEAGARISLDSQQLLDVALARADGEAKLRFALLTQGNSLVLSDLVLSGSEDPTDRSQILKAIAGVGALGPLDVMERIAHVLGGSHRVDDRLLDGLHARTATIGGAWEELGPGVILGPALRHLGRLERLHSHSMTDAQRRRLHAVSADAAALLGHLSHHLNRTTDAMDYCALAQRFARDADDRAVQALVLGMKSMASSTIPNGGQRGDPKTALELLDQADALASHAPPSWRAWLAMRRSAEHALARETVGCWRAFETATRAVEDGDGAEPPSGFLGGLIAAGRTASHVAGVEGLCHTLFGEPRKAEVALIRTLRAVDPTDVEYVAVLLADLAYAYVLQREPEPACKSACAALDVVDGAGLALAVERVRGVRAQFPEPWASLDCVHELDERLRAAACLTST
ncbi:MAG: helix-turn-helix domain-containing protein [Egibacteraceae bacterium]